MNNSIPTRICTQCHTEKPLTTDYYHRHKRMKDGFRPICKVCRKSVEPYNPERYKEYYHSNKTEINSRRKEYWKEYHIKNREKKSEYHKQYRDENKESLKVKSHLKYTKNKKEILAKHKIYYQNNKEKINAQNRKYHKENYEQIKISRRSYFKQYRRDNREKINLLLAKRRSRMEKLDSNFSLKEWNACKDHFDNSCAYCGKQTETLHKEHFIAVSKGGELTLNNIVPACVSCNSSKFNHDFFEWYPNYRHYSKKREQKILSYLGYNNKIQQLALL